MFTLYYTNIYPGRNKYGRGHTKMWKLNFWDDGFFGQDSSSCRSQKLNLNLFKQEREFVVSCIKSKDMKLSFLSQKLWNIDNCIWFNNWKKKSLKVLVSGIVGSRCPDNVRNVSLHIPPRTSPLASFPGKLSTDWGKNSHSALSLLCSLGPGKKKASFVMILRKVLGSALLGWTCLCSFPPTNHCDQGWHVDWPSLGHVLFPFCQGIELVT